jgi:Asp-tRNA(Asn)/Glu-tRNA(Gln) amidotransferase A subunit family amidase
LKRKCIFFEFSGIPAVSVPIRLSAADGLPIALQLMAPHLHERAMLSVARFIEDRVKFVPLNVQHVIDSLENIDQKCAQ